MNFVKRESESSMGIRLLDADHKEIAGLIGQLRASIEGNGDRRLARETLSRLAIVTRTHFALEEGLMASTKYPDYAPHRKCHQQLLQQLDGFISLYFKGELTIDRDSLGFLFVWFAAHSGSDDAQYAGWLAGRDVAPGQIDVSMLPAGGRTSSEEPGKNRNGSPRSWC